MLIPGYLMAVNSGFTELAIVGGLCVFLLVILPYFNHILNVN